MPTKRKIGVLTFHRCINYGSYWQARCLVEGLRARGHDAELLDHDCPRVRRSEWRCALQPTLPERTPRSDFGLYKRKGRRFAEAHAALPLSQRFALEDPSSLQDYDLVVVGSDEVWNFRHPWYGSKPIFFGAGLNAHRLVSYAASFGNHDATDGLAADWAALLRRFESISVRDDNSSRLVQGALDLEPELVLDPCLQFPEVVSDAAIALPNQPEPYALVYGYGFPEWLRRVVQRWSRRLGVRLLSVGYRNDWADEQRITAGPLEFSAWVAGASAVITNFFHGCVFALLHAKPFLSVPSAYRFNKVRDLAIAVGAEDRLATQDMSDRAFDERLGTSPAGVTDRIAALRRRSSAFLDVALA